MTMVYLVIRHPRHPYEHGAYMEAGEVVFVFTKRADARKAADEKNKRKPSFLYAVHGKQLL